jgi:formate dehydrogenase major subunit
VWGAIGTGVEGRSTAEILEACADRQIDVLFLIGVDPLRDLPDAGLTRRALQNARYKVVQGLELGDLAPYADAFLPAVAWPEREGHVTNWEGRSQPIHPVRSPLGVSRPDWEIFVGLAEAMGGDLGFHTLDELREEASRLLAPRDVRRRSTAWTGTGRPQFVGDLTVFSYPLLVDEGRMVEGATELKAALEDDAFAEMHPEDADKYGLRAGGRVRMKTNTGAAELPLRVTADLARGAVFVPFNQPGLAANTLLGTGFVEPVSVEAVEVAATEGAA